MIVSEKHDGRGGTSISAFAAVVLLVAVLLFSPGDDCCARAADGPSRLVRVAGYREGQISWVVLEFDRQATVDYGLTLKKDDVQLRIHNTTSELPAFQRLTESGATIRLEPDEPDLLAHIGIGGDFSDLTYHRLSDPDRWMLKIRRTEASTGPTPDSHIGAAEMPPDREPRQPAADAAGMAGPADVEKQAPQPAHGTENAVSRPPPASDIPEDRLAVDKTGSTAGQRQTSADPTGEADGPAAGAEVAQNTAAPAVQTDDAKQERQKAAEKNRTPDTVPPVSAAGEHPAAQPAPATGAVPLRAQTDKGKEMVPAVESGGAANDGQRMTLNFFNADIQRVLSAIAMQRQINIATSKDVGGTVSVHLYQVSLEEALDAILLSGGYAYHRRGDLYYIYKPKEDADPEAENLQVRVFKLKYADSWQQEDFDKVKEILEAIPGMRTISIHQSSKTIILEDTPENIRKVETIIDFWDTMPKQVMIEAKILEVNLNDDMSMGVNWQQLLGDVRIGTGGFSTAGLPTATAPLPDITGTGVVASMITAVGTATQFSAAIDALRTKTKVDTLSTPKILAIHGRSARVQVGGQQGYKETVTTDAGIKENIKFLETGTILQITPYIDDKKNVLLDVTPDISSVTLEAGVPVVTKTSVNTRLMARNGETVFIAGLIRLEKNNTRNEIPCIGAIPLLGYAFGRNVWRDSRRELVVLITPTVMDRKESDPHQVDARKTMEASEEALEAK